MKKVVAMILVSLGVLGLTGCSITDNDVKSITMTDYRDPDTGVHYWKYSTGNGCGITVRYNADGTIMVD